VYPDRGLCYLEKGRYEEAEKELLAADDVIVRTGHCKGDHWVVTYNIGLTHFR
jgi:hypothetical protein